MGNQEVEKKMMSIVAEDGSIEEVEVILAFEFKDFPYLGIWSKPGAHFVCIEPWFNTADKVSSNGIFEEKEDLIELEPNQEFEAHYTVKFFD